jgi:hypothetical protein
MHNAYTQRYTKRVQYYYCTHHDEGPLHPTLPFFRLTARQQLHQTLSTGLVLQRERTGNEQRHVHEPKERYIVIVIARIRIAPIVADIGNGKHDGHLHLGLGKRGRAWPGTQSLHQTGHADHVALGIETTLALGISFVVQDNVFKAIGRTNGGSGSSSTRWTLSEFFRHERSHTRISRTGAPLPSLAVERKSDCVTGSTFRHNQATTIALFFPGQHCCGRRNKLASVLFLSLGHRHWENDCCVSVSPTGIENSPRLNHGDCIPS